MCPKNWHWLKVSGYKCVDKYQNHYEWLCGNGMTYMYTEVFIHMQVSYWAVKFVNNQLDLSVLALSSIIKPSAASFWPCFA